MKVSMPKFIAIYSTILAVLLILIITLGIALGVKTKKYNDINKKLTLNNSSFSDINETLDKYAKEIEQYSSQLETEKNNNSELQAKLEAAEKEKQKLEQKIKDIQSQMDQLSAIKGEERLKTILKRGSALQSGATPTSKICYLTFDDGPSDNTLRIMEILKKYNNIKASFFVVGAGKLEYLKQIQEAGHSVALHSATHKMKEIYVNEDTFFADLNGISNAVEKQIGIKSKLIRFPGGSSNSINRDLMARLTKLVTEKGYYYFDWNVDSDDAGRSAKNANTIASNVLNQAKNKNTICVLMHDTAAKGATVAALPSIIEGLILMDYRFEPLTEQSNGYHHR